MVHGPLGPDGEISSYEWDELYEVHEDSIQCSRHPGGGLEKFIGGRWCLWVNCPRCHGRGTFTVPAGLREHERECPEEGFTDVEGRVSHGHWFTPGGRPECRTCGVLAESIAGRDPCRGRGHTCPVPVAEGDSDTTGRVRGRDGWLCFQPGELNDTGTEWRCGRGHVITREHVPGGAAHDDVCGWPARCPWRFLTETGTAAVRAAGPLR